VEVGIRRSAESCAHPRLVEIAASDDDVKGVCMSGYAVAHLDEIDEMDDGRCPWRPVRHHFGITAFGVNAWTARDAGDRIINEHDESEADSNEELYLVLRGRAVFELDGDRVDAPAGTFVFARPGVKRTAFAEEPETTIIALGGTPGKAYEPHGWELWAPLNPLYQAGEYAEAADRGRELVEAHPQYADLFYNVACCESLAGRTTDAVDHLRRAINMSERSRAYAKDDSDFDPIRDEPAFKELIGG
jgi:tetratricopeptide (TPR) repeat protein